MARIRTVSVDYITQGDGSDANPYNANAIQKALADAGPYGSVYVQKGTYTTLDLLVESQPENTNIVQKGPYQRLIFEAGVKIVVAPGSPPEIPVYDPQEGTNGLICIGYDGTNTYDGFLLEGNGLILDGGNQSVQLLDVTTAWTKVHDVVLRNFTVRNSTNWAIVIGSPVRTQDITTRVGNVLVENFNAVNCHWLLIYQSEFVTVRHGRCRTLPTLNLNGIFVTAQAPNLLTPIPHTTRFITIEDVDCNSNTTDVGGTVGDTVIEVQGGAEDTDPGTTYGVLFRRCRFRTNRGVAGEDGGVFIDDNVFGGAGQGLIESVAFEDCIFDGPQLTRRVVNASAGYVTFDHCRFLNLAGWTYDLFQGGATYLTRPIIWRRYVGAPNAWPNQNVPVALPPAPNTFTFPNAYQCKVLVVVQGGAVSQISITVRGGTPVLTGRTAGTFLLNEGDSVTVTYSTAPTVTAVPFDR